MSGFSFPSVGHNFYQRSYFLQSETPVNVVLHLDVPFQTIIDRVKDRLVHPASGRIYNTLFNPPKVCSPDQQQFGGNKCKRNLFVLISGGRERR